MGKRYRTVEDQKQSSGEVCNQDFAERGRT